MKTLILDNYDSFTYNLVFMIRELGFNDLTVVRNDQILLEDVEEYDKILLSPGPGLPESAGIMMDIIKEYAPTKSILGVCLGHQGIAEVFGGSLFNLPNVLHGVAGSMHLTDDSESLFDEVPMEFKATHYHSWAIDPDTLPADFKVTVKDDTDMIMGISHKSYDVKGVQFHPESILTEHGEKMLKNWFKIK